jgi:hypothetical protein
MGYRKEQAALREAVPIIPAEVLADSPIKEFRKVKDKAVRQAASIICSSPKLTYTP